VRILYLQWGRWSRSRVGYNSTLGSNGKCNPSASDNSVKTKCLEMSERARCFWTMLSNELRTLYGALVLGS
jgi:hypothetical protein